jgi:uncharacterized SAM-binding protein YcdF (DUF218 family)
MIAVLVFVLGVAVAVLTVSRRHVWPRGRVVLGSFVAAGLIAASAFLCGDTFQLRKLLGDLAMPAGLVWLGGFLLALQVQRLGRRKLAVMAWGVWILFTLAGNRLVGDTLMGWLERNYAAIDPLQQAPFDAIAVLGGGVELRANGRPELSIIGDRVVLAVLMYRRGLVDTLVTTGPWEDLPDGRVRSYPAAEAEMFEELGVPRAHILPVTGPRATSGEIAALAGLVKDRGWKRVGVMTSAWHLRRVMALCRGEGVAATPLPADFVRCYGIEPRWIVPQRDGFMTVNLACWEILGRLVGR